MFRKGHSISGTNIICYFDYVWSDEIRFSDLILASHCVKKLITKHFHWFSVFTTNQGLSNSCSVYFDQFWLLSSVFLSSLLNCVKSEWLLCTLHYHYQSWNKSHLYWSQDFIIHLQIQLGHWLCEVPVVNFIMWYIPWSFILSENFI